MSTEDLFTAVKQLQEPFVAALSKAKRPNQITKLYHELVSFKKYYIFRCGPGKIGRHAKLADHATVLGLLLSFYCDTMSIKTLCRMFAAPPTTIGRTLRKVTYRYLNFEIYYFHQLTSVYSILSRTRLKRRCCVHCKANQRCGF